MNEKNHLLKMIFESGYLLGSHYGIQECDSLIIRVDKRTDYLVGANSEVFLEVLDKLSAQFEGRLALPFWDTQVGINHA